jgi:hypothetical protein
MTLLSTSSCERCGQPIAQTERWTRCRKHHPWRAALGIAFGVVVFLATLTFLAGCGLHAQTKPFVFETCAFYCRQTHCPGQPIPSQLAEARRPTADLPPVSPPPCDTLEVGPKTLADVIAAIGTAVVAFFSHGIL